MVFLHNCDEQQDYDRLMDPEGLLGLARGYVRDGKARFIGFSGHTVSTAQQAVASGEIDVLMFPVNLAGNSLGGAVATTVAAGRPDLVGTLTLLAPALPHVKPGLEKLPIVLGIAPRAADLLAWARGNQSAEERVDETMRETGRTEVPSQMIGDAVIEELRKLDEVAYIRYAIVYMGLKDLESIRAEIDRLRLQRHCRCFVPISLPATT